MIRFAHRGGRAHAPENTLDAFELALHMGADGLESDVWVTADGVAVLDHDGLVGASATAIADVPHRELPAHIPLLADLYVRCGAAFELSLDVKDPLALGAVLDVARAVAGATDHLWLCFHRWRQLAEWRAAAHDVRLVDSTYVGFMSAGPEQRASQLVAAGIDAVNLHHSEWTPALHATFADHGLTMLAWDVQDVGDVVRMRRLGIDGVFGDHVDRLMAADG